jgi:hypothetical protein
MISSGMIGDSISLLPVIGLPLVKSLLLLYPLKLMEGFMTDSRNIIIVKKGENNNFVIKKDQYAAPQNVFHISGNTGDDI